MASGTEDIIQNIILAGEANVIAGLNSIGNAGVQAFEAIGTAVGNLGNIGAAFAGLAGTAGALAGVTAGIFALSDAASNNVVKMANFADEMGTTTGNMGLFITALNEAGNQTADLTVSFRRIAVAVEAAFPKMQKQVREASNTIKEDFIKVGEAAVELSFQSTKAAETQIKDAQNVAAAKLSLSKASLEASRIDQTNQIASIQASQSVIGAINNLTAAQFNLRQIQGGVSEAEKQQFAVEQAQNAIQQAETELRLALIRQQREEEEQGIRRQQALLDVKQKQLALDEALRKQAEDAALAPFKHAEAELKLAQAQEKQKEDQVNSISALKKFIDDLAVGADVSGQKVQISTQNVIKGLIASVGASANALQGFSGDLGDVTTKTPALFDVMKKVADVFEHTKDATLRAALATALFGRGYSFSLVAALEEGGAALEKNMNRLKALGFEYTSFDEHIGRDFLKALNSVESELKILGTQMGLTFAPSFTVILRQIQNAVENNRAGIVAWAAGIRDSAIPVIAGFLKAIAGIDVTKALQLNPEQIIQAQGWADTFDKIKRFIVDFAVGAKDIIVNTITPAFTAVTAGLQVVADGINKVFGTKLTVGDLGIGALILVFTNLGAAILSVSQLLLGLTLILVSNPFGATVVLIGAVVGALIVMRNAIVANKAAMDDWVTTKVSGAFNWLSDAFEDAATKIKRGYEDLRQQAIDTLTFSLASTVAANNKIIEAARKAEDEATANARRIRDAANITGGATATGDPNSLTPSFDNKAVTAPIDEAKQKWTELGKTIEEVTTQTKTGLKTTALDAITVTEEASAEVANKVTQNVETVKRAFKDEAKAAAFAAQDMKSQAAAIAFNSDPYGDGRFAKSTASGINPFLGTSNSAAEINGPERTVIPKGQALQDLTEINNALKATQQTIVRTFGGEGVEQAKVHTESIEQSKQAIEGYASSATSATNATRLFAVEEAQSAKDADGIKQPLQDAANALSDFGKGAEAIKFTSGDLTNPFQQASEEIKQSFQSLPEAFQTIFDQIVDKASQAAEKIAQSFQQASQAATSAGGSSGDSSNSSFLSPVNPPSGPGFASGGLFRGRGGVDTNLAWLTDFEFIMNPSAVRHWGVDFMHSLNRLQAPTGSGFSMGGLFRSVGSRLNTPLIPAFAAGGLNRSTVAGSSAERRALSLTLGGHTFSGLSGPANVIDALELRAVHDQLKTSGYQPRWKK